MYNPGKLCPKKNLPVLGSFFVDARLPAPDFFLLESKYTPRAQGQLASGLLAGILVLSGF